MSSTTVHLVTAASFLLGSIVLALLSRWIFRNVIRKFYSRTKSEFDDVIFKSLERPLMLLIITLGLYGAAATVVHMDIWGLSAVKLDAYSGKISQILSAVLTVVVALGILGVLNGIAEWYIHSVGSKGASYQIRVLKKLANAVIWAIVIALALGQLGYKVSALLATLGVAGLAVALALQDTLANVFAGFYIMADRSVKAGDYIKLDSGDEGFVEDIGWRNTRIRLWANNTVIVPNSKLIQSILTNYDLPQQQLSVYISCGVGYNSDLDYVEQVTIDVGRQVLQDVPGAVTDFEPIVRFKEFGDSNINFLTILRAKDVASQYLIHHEFIKRLHRRYREEGIEISYPVRVVEMRTTDTQPSEQLV
ncbi:mechanosensitive ion channel family protein [bacterium]|nr:mechanosensitive ion channel family protein [bacterium]